jgi:hypothetical protein
VNLFIRRAMDNELTIVLDLLTEAAAWHAVERQVSGRFPYPAATVDVS